MRTFISSLDTLHTYFYFLRSLVNILSFGIILSGARPNYCSCTSSNTSQQEQADKLRGRQNLKWEQLEGLIKIHSAFSMLVFTVISSPPLPFLHTLENPSQPLTFPWFSIRKIAAIAMLRYIPVKLDVHYFLWKQNTFGYNPGHFYPTSLFNGNEDFKGFIKVTFLVLHVDLCIVLSVPWLKRTKQEIAPNRALDIRLAQQMAKENGVTILMVNKNVELQWQVGQSDLLFWRNMMQALIDLNSQIKTVLCARTENYSWQRSYWGC